MTQDTIWSKDRLRVASILVARLALLASSFGIGRVEAAPCGGATLCSCGDTVTADRTLMAGATR